MKYRRYQIGTAGGGAIWMNLEREIEIIRFTHWTIPERGRKG